MAKANSSASRRAIEAVKIMVKTLTAISVNSRETIKTRLNLNPINRCQKLLAIKPCRKRHYLRQNRKIAIRIIAMLTKAILVDPIQTQIARIEAAGAAVKTNSKFAKID